jgi:hypothetical protein
MKTVNSLSGGKTSSYIAIHYPADYNVFALVHVEDPKLTPKDKKLVQMVSDKIGMEFIGTAESDLTLKVLFDLEQEIGKEIIWVKEMSFEELIKQRSGIPNKMWRFCTTEMKMMPIFHWWLQNIGEIVSMRIGFRLDEFERSEKLTTTVKYRRSQSLTGTKRYSWDEIEWRVGSFPLIDDGLTHYDIVKYWDKRHEYKFPNSSNCLGCFWKSPQELRQNWEEEPIKMQWFADQENKMGNQFKTEISMKDIKKMGLQHSMFFGGGSCQSEGYCTD